jgi:hypothetical protein
LPANVADPILKLELQKKWNVRHDELIKWCQVSGFILVGVTAVVLYILKPSGWDRPEFTTPETLILLFWIVIIPIYLFVEYATFWDKISPEFAEHLRYFQELTCRVWVALVIIFASICIGKFFGPLS